MATRKPAQAASTSDDNAVATTSDTLTVEKLADRTLEKWSNTELRELEDFEQAIRVATETYGGIDDVTRELGNGFALLSKEDKKKLVGQPFLALYWTFNPGDYGGHFASMAAMTPDGGRFILNDGGTGIYQDLLTYTQEHGGRQGGLMCSGGLRESTYDTCKGCGKPRNKLVAECTNNLSNGTVCGNTEEGRDKGTTYYIETSRQPA